MSCINTSNSLTHIAFIPDGNRRWAREKGLSSLFGHKYGYDVIKKLAVCLPRYQIKYASFFCFSVENWQRSGEEINYLMDLFCNFFSDSDSFLDKHGINIRVIGDLSKISSELRDNIHILEEKTKNNNVITMIGAVSYSGRDEIVRATKKIAHDVLNNKVNIDDINESIFSEYFDCPDIPYPDLLVRTSEQRISNFLLWQLAYSEIMFIDKFWPDFSENDIKDIVKNFYARKRRYGK